MHKRGQYNPYLDLGLVHISPRRFELMTSRKPRVRIQIMLAAETAELVQKEASELGISVSAMGAVLIKRGLKTEKEEERSQ